MTTARMPGGLLPRLVKRHSCAIVWRSPVVRLLGAGLLAVACADATAPFPPNSDGAPGVAGAPPSVNPLAGASFYLQANSHAQRQADTWRASRPADAAEMDKIATRPQAVWFGSWSGDVRAAVSAVMNAAAVQGTVPVLVTYHITRLDCRSGGATPDGYRNWINSFVAGIGSGRAVVILEPDALPAMGCLSAAEQETRVALLRFAVAALAARPGVTLYIDAGHPRWQSASEMARRLSLAGVEMAHGFSLNVSNFIRTADNVAYGADISTRLGGKRFVIDTGRNGQGPTPDYQWCNPDGRGLGLPPTTATGHPSADGYIWVKPPGESDGTCNGGPRAGQWWPEYALGLARRSP